MAHGCSKSSDGKAAYWTKAFALADDFEESDGKSILTFYQAQDQAKKLARGEDGSADTAPIRVDGALTDYKRDLEARQANPYNAGRSMPETNAGNAVPIAPRAD